MTVIVSWNQSWRGVLNTQMTRIRARNVDPQLAPSCSILNVLDALRTGDGHITVSISAVAEPSMGANMRARPRHRKLGFCIVFMRKHNVFRACDLVSAFSLGYLRLWLPPLRLRCAAAQIQTRLRGAILHRWAALELAGCTRNLSPPAPWCLRALCRRPCMCVMPGVVYIKRSCLASVTRALSESPSELTGCLNRRLAAGAFLRSLRRSRNANRT